MSIKHRTSEKNKACTLIELLVVISIIALLLSILLPALRRAKEMGMRAVCLSNLHQLTLGWMAYAGDNRDQLVNAGTGTFADGHPIDVNGRKVDGWVGWRGLTSTPDFPPSNSSSSFGTTVEDQLLEITDGALYPYSSNSDAYNCPVSRKGNERSYAIVDPMNGFRAFVNHPAFNLKIGDIKSPAARIVFLDSGEQSLASWTLVPRSEDWMEPVASRHGDGTTFSFADGHAERWAWTHQNTKEIGKLSLYEYYDLFKWNCRSKFILSTRTFSTAENEDFIKIQKSMWRESYQ